jgi:hypothetical protein
MSLGYLFIQISTKNGKKKVFLSESWHLFWSWNQTASLEFQNSDSLSKLKNMFKYEGHTYPRAQLAHQIVLYVL